MLFLGMLCYSSCTNRSLDDDACGEIPVKIPHLAHLFYPDSLEDRTFVSFHGNGIVSTRVKFLDCKGTAEYLQFDEEGMLSYQISYSSALRPTTDSVWIQNDEGEMVARKHRFYSARLNEERSVCEH